MHPLTPPNSHHLEAAHGWLKLGDHVAAFDELEKIEPKLRGHPDVLEVRVDIYAKAGKWDYCVEIGDALVRVALSGFRAGSSVPTPCISWGRRMKPTTHCTMACINCGTNTRRGTTWHAIHARWMTWSVRAR